jgi:endonuclease-3
MPRSNRRPSNDPKAQARRVVAALEQLYPDANCALSHEGPFQLLVATILSAQCTDARVNLVTPELFRQFPTAVAMARAELADLENVIRSIGFFRAKARNLKAMAERLVERHGGEVPADLDALTELAGVGRKTANVVLGTAFGIPSGVVVDTHVKRLSYRLGLTREQTPEKVERDLMETVPPSSWILLSHQLIQHGRRDCQARRPRCSTCALEPLCPRAGVGTSA